MLVYLHDVGVAGQSRRYGKKTRPNAAHRALEAVAASGTVQGLSEGRREPAQQHALQDDPGGRQHFDGLKVVDGPQMTMLNTQTRGTLD